MRRHYRRMVRITDVASVPRMTRLVARFQPTAPGHRLLFQTLDAAWKLISKAEAAVLAGGVVVSGIIGVIKKRWPIVSLARSHPALSAFVIVVAFAIAAVSLAGHLLWTAAETRRKRLLRLSTAYALTSVAATLPEDLHVYRFSDACYAQRLDLLTDRDADEAAREVIRRASACQSDGPLGVYIVGRALLGKTRLAYESVRQELPDWRVVRWSSKDKPPTLDALLLWGERIVLWLDDLHEYSKLEATRIRNFIIRLKTLKICFVIVSTCRDGDALERARAEVGRFPLDRMEEVQPGFIAVAQAKRLAQSVDNVDPKRKWDQRLREWDQKTPGSILFSMTYYRNTVWPRLPRHAKHVMWALQLLHSANLTLFESRARAVCDEIFRWPAKADAEWRSAMSKLEDAHYLNSPVAEEWDALADEKNRPTDPPLTVDTDGMLEEGIETFSGWTSDNANGWPHLKMALSRSHDAPGLIRLGEAYFGRADETKRKAPMDTSGWRGNLAHACTCYGQAVAIYRTRREDDEGFVVACQSLAITYAHLASSCGGRREKDRLYRRAERLMTHALRRCEDRSKKESKQSWTDLMRKVQDDLESIEADPEREEARGDEADDHDD